MDPVFLLLDAANLTAGFNETFEYVGPITGYAETYVAAGYELVLPLSGRVGPGVDSLQFVGEDEGQADYWRRLGSSYMAVSTSSFEADIAHMAAPACSTPRYELRQSMSCLRLPLKGAGGATFATEINGPVAEREALAEQYDTWASSFSVDVSNGGMTFSPPADIVSGAGGYPYSLAFQRTYNSASDTPGPLGNGWSHNLEARVSVGSNISSATSGGAQTSVATIIAADAVLRLFETNWDQVDLVRALLVQNWWAETLVNNHVSVQRGSGSSQFYRMPGGGFISGPGSISTLVQSGAIVVDEEFEPYAENSPENWQGIANKHYQAFDYRYLSFVFSDGTGLTENYAYGADRTRGTGILPVANNNASQEIGSYNTFLRAQTAFPTGVVVTFDYSGEVWPGVLTSVSNNVGRTLNLSYTYTDPLNPPNEQVPGNAPLGPAYILSSVTTETGRSVNFAFDTTGLVHNGRHLASVTLPDSSLYSYEYSPQYVWSASGGSGLPSMPLVQRHLLSEIRLPHAPTNPYFTFGYDELGRLVSVTDADGDTTTYGAGEGARGFTQDPLGNQAWSYFDQDGRSIASVSPRGILSASYFDGIGRVIESRVREAGWSEDRYDARSTATYDHFNNVTSQTAQPSTEADGTVRSGTPIISMTAYNHPTIPTLPTRSTDAEGNVSVVCYSTSTIETECSGRPLDADDRGGLPQASVGPSGEETLIEYDSLGRVTRQRVRVED